MPEFALLKHGCMQGISSCHGLCSQERINSLDIEHPLSSHLSVLHISGENQFLRHFISKTKNSPPIRRTAAFKFLFPNQFKFNRNKFFQFFPG